MLPDLINMVKAINAGERISQVTSLLEVIRKEPTPIYYIDLFCGAGGTSSGVESATVSGRKAAKVIACVNHDKNAIASHFANHPDAIHYTEDIRTLDISPLKHLVRSLRVIQPEATIVLWASLECTNFSKAKGGQPRDADSRTLAEHLFRYIEGVNPDYIQIENVAEFMSWGDMDKNGKPLSKDKGRLYSQWVSNVLKHGYVFQHRLLNSADYGAYTSRKRFFGIFSRQGMPISWPEPTHSKTPISGEAPWRPVKEVLDFTDEGKSIFRAKPLSEKTLGRIYAGLVKFVAGGKDKWILKYNSVNGKTGKHNPPSIDEPCHTISCQGRLGVISTHFLSKQYSGHPDSKNVSVDNPAGTITCVDHHAFISAYYGNGDNVSKVDKPSPTVTCKDRLALVQSTFIDQQYGCSLPATIEKPLGSITTNPKYNLVSVKNHYLMNPQFTSAGGSIENPCFTLIARMDKMPPYMVATEHGIGIGIYETDSPMTQKIKEFMSIYGIADVKMRMLRIPELKQIMGFPKEYTLIGTQADQKKFIGNAVEVTIARALCEALVKSLVTYN